MHKTPRPTSHQWINRWTNRFIHSLKDALPLGFHVRVSNAEWQQIVSIKRPSMRGRERLVQETLMQPQEIRVSRSDINVSLFYRPERPRRWICAVAKRLNDSGFLVTAYPTDAIKEGTRVWPR